MKFSHSKLLYISNLEEKKSQGKKKRKGKRKEKKRERDDKSSSFWLMIFVFGKKWRKNNKFYFIYFKHSFSVREKPTFNFSFFQLDILSRRRRKGRTYKKSLIVFFHKFWKWSFSFLLCLWWQSWSGVNFTIILFLLFYYCWQNWPQGSISSKLCEQPFCVQIPKVQKRELSCQSFLHFWVLCVCKSACRTLAKLTTGLLPLSKSLAGW